MERVIVSTERPDGRYGYQYPGGCWLGATGTGLNVSEFNILVLMEDGNKLILGAATKGLT